MWVHCLYTVTFLFMNCYSLTFKNLFFLNTDSLELRRLKSYLVTMYKVVHGFVFLNSVLIPVLEVVS